MAAAGRPPGRGRDFARNANAPLVRREREHNAFAAHSFDAINRVFSNAELLPTLLRGPLLGIAGLPPLARLLWRRAAGL